MGCVLTLDHDKYTSKLAQNTVANPIIVDLGSVSNKLLGKHRWSLIGLTTLQKNDSLRKMV